MPARDDSGQRTVVMEAFRGREEEALSIDRLWALLAEKFPARFAKRAAARDFIKQRVAPGTSETGPLLVPSPEGRGLWELPTWTYQQQAKVKVQEQ